MDGKWRLTRSHFRADVVASTGTEAFPGRELTNVRINWIIPRASQFGNTRPPARRARSRVSAIEILEVRGLLSVMAPIRSVPIEFAASDPPAILVVASASTRPDDHSTSAQTASASAKPDARDRAPKGDDDNPADSASDARNTSNSAGAIRRSNSSNASRRELADALIVDPRNTDPESSALTGDAPSTGPELMSGLGGGDVPDLATTPLSLLGSAQDTANLPGLGLDGRAAGASTAATMPPSSGTVDPSLENSGDRQSAPGPTGDQQGQHSVSVAASNAGPAISAWANLLSGTLHADWDAVDVDLRQFLARLGGLTDDSAGPGSGPAWPFWLGAATVLIVARRASSGRRRLFRRPVAGELRGFTRRPIPVGPWPLGSP